MPGENAKAVNIYDAAALCIASENEKDDRNRR